MLLEMILRPLPVQLRLMLAFVVGGLGQHLVLDQQDELVVVHDAQIHATNMRTRVFVVVSQVRFGEQLAVHDPIGMILALQPLRIDEAREGFLSIEDDFEQVAVRRMEQELQNAAMGQLVRG